MLHSDVSHVHHHHRLRYDIAFAFSLWAANSSLFERKMLNPDILKSYRNGTHTYADRKLNEEIFSSSMDLVEYSLTRSILRTFPITPLKYTWTTQNIYLSEKPAVNREYLLNTLTHEIGHALGLIHSPREDSIMFAFVSNNNNKTIKYRGHFSHSTTLWN